LVTFNSFSTSLGTLWQFLIGNPPDYYQLSSSNRVLGPLYYALFTIFVFFILVNMFIAIMSNSYALVSKAQRSETKLNDLQKPFKRIAKMAKVVANRKPLYTETDLLVKLKDRSILEKDIVTKQELEQALREALPGEDPLSLYVERLLSIHERRKKFLDDLIVEAEENEREKEEEKYERRLDKSIIEPNARMSETEMTPFDDKGKGVANDNNNSANEDSASDATTALAELQDNYAESFARMTKRLDGLEEKLYLIFEKLDKKVN